MDMLIIIFLVIALGGVAVMISRIWRAAGLAWADLMQPTGAETAPYTVSMSSIGHATLGALLVALGACYPGPWWWPAAVLAGAAGVMLSRWWRVAA